MRQWLSPSLLPSGPSKAPLTPAGAKSERTRSFICVSSVSSNRPVSFAADTITEWDKELQLSSLSPHSLHTNTLKRAVNTHFPLQSQHKTSKTQQILRKWARISFLWGQVSATSTEPVLLESHTELHTEHNRNRSAWLLYRFVSVFSSSFRWKTKAVFGIF